MAMHPETWAALAEHLYPGAFIFAFGGPKTYHRLALALEDAGLRLFPPLGWLQGQGFPKATRIDTQIDKAAGKYEEREVVGRAQKAPGWFTQGDEFDITAPATDLARAWAGHRYGLQALKPCLEFIAVAQKPYQGRPVDCIVETGAGAFWIDGARIGTNPDVDDPRLGGQGSWNPTGQSIFFQGQGKNVPSSPQGRWPANFALCHNAPEICPDCGGSKWKVVSEVPMSLCPNCLADEGGTWLPDAPDICPDCGAETTERMVHQNKLPCATCGGTGLVGGCVRAGTRRVKGTGTAIRHNVGVSPRGIYSPGTGEPEPDVTYADPDGLETVAAWRCTESCVVRRLGEQSGERPSGGRNAGQSWVRKGNIILDENTAPDSVVYRDYVSDTGTAARFFFQADWSYEIAERLAAADPVRYCPKSARGERDQGLEGVVRLRRDLSEEQRSWVLGELQKAGVEPFG